MNYLLKMITVVYFNRIEQRNQLGVYLGKGYSFLPSMKPLDKSKLITLIYNLSFSYFFFTHTVPLDFKLGIDVLIIL